MNNYPPLLPQLQQPTHQSSIFPQHPATYPYPPPSLPEPSNPLLDSVESMRKSLFKEAAAQLTQVYQESLR